MKFENHLNFTTAGTFPVTRSQSHSVLEFPLPHEAGSGRKLAMHFGAVGPRSPFHFHFLVSHFSLFLSPFSLCLGTGRGYGLVRFLVRVNRAKKPSLLAWYGCNGSIPLDRVGAPFRPRLPSIA